jgi:hypothetical protein
VGTVLLEKPKQQYRPHLINKPQKNYLTHKLASMSLEVLSSLNLSIDYLLAQKNLLSAGKDLRY